MLKTVVCPSILCPISVLSYASSIYIWISDKIKSVIWWSYIFWSLLFTHKNPHCLSVCGKSTLLIHSIINCPHFFPRWLINLICLILQGNDVGTQYRSGIYFYTPEQEKAANESLERQQKTLDRKIVSEILPAKKFYRAEEYHQQYLEKGGRFGFQQSASKGCTDPIRCYGWCSVMKHFFPRTLGSFN